MTAQAIRNEDQLVNYLQSYEASMYKMALARTVPGYDVDDLVQELREVIIEHWHKFDDRKGDFHTWAYNAWRHRLYKLVRDNTVVRKRRPPETISYNEDLDLVYLDDQETILLLAQLDTLVREEEITVQERGIIFTVILGGQLTDCKFIELEGQVVKFNKAQREAFIDRMQRIFSSLLPAKESYEQKGMVDHAAQATC